MTLTRQFLLDLANYLDQAQRHTQDDSTPFIIIEDEEARRIADTARTLAGAPSAPVKVMPTPIPPVTAMVIHPIHFWRP